MVCLLAVVWGLTFRTDELPRGIRGVQYDAAVETQVDGRCPKGDVELSLAAGALPPGLHLVSTGISGVARETGKFRFSLRASNGCRWVIQRFELLVTGPPMVEAWPDKLEFEAQEGDTAALRKFVMVSGGWPDLAYVTAGAKPWLKLTPLTGRTPGRGSPLFGDQLTVEVNPGALAPGTYRTTVEVSAWGAANAPSVEVVLKVSPRP